MEDVPCTYRISVKAIIKDNAGRVLLLREKNGSWELPGGGLEHGEDMRQALSREVTEETGHTVNWMSDRPEACWTIRKDVGSSRLTWFAFIAYGAKVSGEFKPGMSDEAHEARYFSEEEVAGVALHDNTKPYFLPA